MSDLRDQDSQLEKLQSWWEQNGRATVIGIVVALAVVFGWQGWNRYQDNLTEQAALAYQELLDAEEAAARDPQRRETARHLAQTLREDFGGTVYGKFGALYQAKYAAQQEEWESAEEALRWILAERPDEVLEQQTRVRLGRILLDQQRYEEAQDVLASGETGAYAALIAELRGDIHHAQGRDEEALAAYRQARNLLAEREEREANPLLEMKIQDLQPAATSRQQDGES